MQFHTVAEGTGMEGRAYHLMVTCVAPYPNSWKEASWKEYFLYLYFGYGVVNQYDLYVQFYKNY